MKNFVKVTLKNGQIIDIQAYYQEFVTIWKEATESTATVVFSDELNTFKYNDIELVQSATQEDGTERITKEALDLNITRLGKELENFKKFRENMTTPDILISELADAITKQTMADLASEPVKIETAYGVETLCEPVKE